MAEVFGRVSNGRFGPVSCELGGDEEEERWVELLPKILMLERTQKGADCARPFQNSV